MKFSKYTMCVWVLYLVRHLESGSAYRKAGARAQGVRIPGANVLISDDMAHAAAGPVRRAKYRCNKSTYLSTNAQQNAIMSVERQGAEEEREREKESSSLAIKLRIKQGLKCA